MVRELWYPNIPHDDIFMRGAEIIFGVSGQFITVNSVDGLVVIY